MSTLALPHTSVNIVIQCTFPVCGIQRFECWMSESFLERHFGSCLTQEINFRLALDMHQLVCHLTTNSSFSSSLFKAPIHLCGAIVFVTGNNLRSITVGLLIILSCVCFLTNVMVVLKWGFSQWVVVTQCVIIYVRTDPILIGIGRHNFLRAVTDISVTTTNSNSITIS